MATGLISAAQKKLTVPLVAGDYASPSQGEAPTGDPKGWDSEGNPTPAAAVETGGGSPMVPPTQTPQVPTGGGSPIETQTPTQSTTVPTGGGSPKEGGIIGPRMMQGVENMPDAKPAPTQNPAVQNQPDAKPTNAAPENTPDDPAGTIYSNTGNGATAMGTTTFTNNGPVAGAGANGGIGTTTAPGALTGEAWKPTGGIVDQIQGITPETITGTGYTAATTPETQTATATGYGATGYNATTAVPATGYTAGGYTGEGYNAAQQDENVSQAIDRIIGKDSPLMQRAAAGAAQQANARGILNTSMAVEAGQNAVLDKAHEIGAGDVQAGQFNVAQKNQALQFSADARNHASEFLAAATNRANEFLASETNTTGRFNAQQANEASAFSAQATNQANALLAAAQNTASMFNSGQANQRAMFATEQANLAAKYAADAANAAAQFNATAHNEAMQRYTDAMNAAIAAQNDAENLARRDTATIAAQTNIANIGAQASIAGSQAAAGASMHNSDVAAATSRANTTDQIAGQLQAAGMQIDASTRQWMTQMGAQMFGQFQQGMQNIMGAQMEPGDRQNAIHNYMSLWSGAGYLPFDINMDNFPPAGGTTPPPAGGTTPPPGGTPANGLAPGNSHHIGVGP
jgi:hypothetical protein